MCHTKCGPDAFIPPEMIASGSHHIVHPAHRVERFLRSTRAPRSARPLTAQAQHLECCWSDQQARIWVENIYPDRVVGRPSRLRPHETETAAAVEDSHHDNHAREAETLPLAPPDN